jgi:methylmalonyl-CoA mutase
MTAVPTQPPEHLPLAALFAPAERAQWQQLVAGALRKSGRLAPDDDAALVEAVLSSTTYDGVTVQPLYTADDAPDVDRAGVPGAAPFVRGATASGPVPNGWDVRQRHAHPDPEVTREAVMADLENGVTSIWLAVGARGVPLGSLGQVLRDVYLDLAPVVLDAGPDTEAAAEELLGVIAERGVVPAGGNFGADPIGLQARTGRAADQNLIVRLAEKAGATGIRAITVDGPVHHDAGGSDADELGASIATGLAYLRTLTDAGLSLEQAFGQLDFRYAAGADQFLTIAKFRAARRLWARVAQVCGAQLIEGPIEGQRQHAVTSSAMMTQRDPWVNLLRTTLACFGAGVGGAQAITVQPFDAALGLPDGFSRRIARNTSSLLVMEAHVARVIDPAGGSWYVERLTDELAEAGWAWFTEIERAGGMLAALDDGLIAQRLEQTWARRCDNLAHRRDPLTGVSEFPNLDENPVKRAPFPEEEAKAPSALPQHRYAEAYEALRDAADEARESGTPQVFLATIGPVAVHTARAGFAANLFQAGGLATPGSGPATDPAAIAAAFTGSGARVACLASSDRLYAEHAAPVAEALKKAGAQAIWLAGKPGEREAQDRAAGVTGYVYAGMDALGVLKQIHQQAGVSR